MNLIRSFFKVFFLFSPVLRAALHHDGAAHMGLHDLAMQSRHGYRVDYRRQVYNRQGYDEE